MPEGMFIHGHVFRALWRSDWLARDRTVNRPRIYRITDTGREAITYVPKVVPKRPKPTSYQIRNEIIWPDVDALSMESQSVGAQQQVARAAAVDWRSRAVLTEKEVAEALHVSPETVWRLRSLGKIGFYKVGALTRFSPKHVLEYLESVEQRARRRR
jgi:excisionase family DNA binding protein